MKRILIVLAVLLAGSAILYQAGASFSHALTSADPYPAFMAEYELGGSRSYQEAERAFSDFVVKAFPVGSDAGDAIAQITGGGFQATKSTSESAELVWKRHAGPCSEVYSIALRANNDRRIADIVGRLQPICL